MAIDPEPSVDLAGRVLDPLWRGLIGYRVLAWAYAAALAAANHQHYRSPAIALAVLVGMAVWTVLTGVGYLRGARVLGLSGLSGRAWLAVLDLLVTLVGVASTVLVETPQRIAEGAPVITTIWSAGPAIALALACGAVRGLLGALAVQAAVLLVRGRLGAAELTDLLLTVAAALAVGYAATVLRRSAEQLRRAIALRAAVAERERLARSIHDGVLQVLARVSRRGAELGGAAAELGSLAGEQEVALRTLVAAGPPVERPAGQLDLATRLDGLSTSTVTVSVPASAVLLSAPRAREVVAAVEAALDNVRRHVGPRAPAWVLVEDRGDRAVVSIRDDGPGIPDGRLAAAEGEGRLGVRQSIRARIEMIGATADCVTGPGLGCEWTFEVPYRDGSAR